VKPTPEQLDAALRSWGDEPVPDIDAAFVAGLDRPAAAVLPLAPRRLRYVVPAVGAAAAVVLGVLLVRQPGSPPAELVASSGVEVVLPGGEVTDPTAGALPHGATVRTGPDGRASVVIDDETLEIGPDQSIVVTTTTAVPATTTTPAVAEPGPVSLHAERAGPAVTLRWTAFTGDGFARWVLLRAAGSEPTWPRSAGTTVVIATDDEGRRHWDDGAVPRGDVSYLVVALDAADRVLARSPVARPSGPPPSDPHGDGPPDGGDDGRVPDDD
jgi:hypothetical protein